MTKLYLDIMEKSLSAYIPERIRTYIDRGKITTARLISSYTVNIHMFNWKENEKFPLIDAKDIWRKYLAFLKAIKRCCSNLCPTAK